MDAENTRKYEKLTASSSGDFKAFLYDCDGTLADNMAAHRATYVAIAKDYGVEIDPAMIDELAGWPVVDVAKEINRRYGSAMDPVEFAARRHRLFVDSYMEQVKPIPFVVKHLIDHVGKVKIAVVSGGERESVEKTLHVIGVLDLVEAIVCAGETPKGKPYPDPFLAAAEALDAPPDQCLVFEDGDPGVKAAEAAGMSWVRIDKI